MAGIKGKSGRRLKENGARTTIHINQQVYDTLKRRGMNETIEQLTRDSMKSGYVTVSPSYENQWNIVKEMSRYDLQDLEMAIHVRLVQIAADALEKAGFPCRTRVNHEAFRYVLVYPPDGSIPAVWASLDECQRLLDTVRNMSPQEAYTRWVEKVEPLGIDPCEYAQSLRDIPIKAE